MAGLPVNNNLNAFSHTVSRNAGTQGSQSAPYGSTSSAAKQEDALKDSFDSVMNRVNAQTKSPAAAQNESRKTVTAQTDERTASPAKTAGGSHTMASNATAESVKQDTARSEKAANAEDDQSVETGADDKNVETKVPDAEQGSKAAENNSVESVEEESVEETAGNAVSGEQKEAVTEAGEKLVEDIAGEMGVTPEEVLEVMAMLGFSVAQLFDPDNMKQLLVAISGNEDPMSIITDGELYSHLQNLLNTVSESLDGLQTELELPEEELKTLIARMTEAEKSPETAGEAEELITAAKPEETQTPEGMKDYAVTVHRDGEEVKVKVQVEDGGANKSVREEVVQTSEVQNRNEAGTGSRDSFEENRGEGNAQNHFVMQTPVEQPVLNEAAVEQTAMERFTSTEDIMNQITEYIKINLKSDVQEMELQLHPASLGSVNVQLAAKDGVITAQFTAQNETVRAAIESQLVQLRTQFEEQGIKVDAVEVTVANYRFEQNFSGKEENPGEGSKNGKKGPRRINLNDMSLEELSEGMEDSERIAAEMMARNGNTVDYTA